MKKYRVCIKIEGEDEFEIIPWCDLEGNSIDEVSDSVRQELENLINCEAVVRCRDCKWYDSAFHVCSKCGVCVNRDFYCTDGER